MTEQTVRCKICGRPYKFYAHSAADQSACPKCVYEAENKMRWVPEPPSYDKNKPRCDIYETMQ